jgi:hypothetical protein
MHEESRPVLTFRAPRLARLYVAVFGLVWCGGVAYALVRTAASDEAPLATALIPVVMLSFGGTFLVRTLRLGVDVHADRLEVRNLWRTERVERAQITDVRVGDGPIGSFGRTAHLLTRDHGLVRLDVVASNLPFGRGRRRLDERVERLRRWPAGDPRVGA